MTDRKDGPSKGPDRASESGGARRPFATIDLKATELKQAPAKADAPEAAAAARVAAAAAATSSTASAPPAASAAPQAAVTAAEQGNARPTGSVPRTHAGGASAGRGDDDAERTGTGAETATGAAGAAARLTEHQPAPPAARSGLGVGRFLSHVAAGLLGGAVAILGAPHIAPLLGLDGLVAGGQAPASISSPEIIGRLTALERNLREQRQTQPAAADTTAQKQALDAALLRVEELSGQLAGLREAQTRFAAETIATVTELRTAPRPASDPGERLVKLEEQIAQMAAAAAADPQRAGRLPQLAQLTGKVADLETQLATRLDRLLKDVRQELETRVGAAAEASEAARAGTQRLDREVAAVRSDATRLGERVSQVKGGTDRLDEAMKALQATADGLRGALDGFKAEVDREMKAMARPADVARAVTPVADRLAALEGGMQGIARAEEDRRTNAERIVLSLELGNLKRAMERGTRYEAELAEVRRIAGSRLDLAPLERWQASGVPTVAELGRLFRPVANAVLDVDATPENAGVMDKIITGAKTIVRVRKTTHAPDDNSAEAVVARMEASLKDGRLADVLAEARKLTPRLAAPAKAWLEKVEARQSVDAALVAIDQALKSSLGGAPAQKGGSR